MKIVLSIFSTLFLSALLTLYYFAPLLYTGTDYAAFQVRTKFVYKTLPDDEFLYIYICVEPFRYVVALRVMHHELA